MIWLNKFTLYSLIRVINHLLHFAWDFMWKIHSMNSSISHSAHTLQHQIIAWGSAIPFHTTWSAPSFDKGTILDWVSNIGAVSYTHLDVYKRQIYGSTSASDIPDLFLARSEEEANKSNSVVLLNEDNQGIILCKLHGSTYFSYTNTKRSLTRSTAHSTTGQFLK